MVTGVGTTWFEGEKPATKFGPKFRAPIYVGVDGSADFVKRLTDYVFKIEKDIIEKEELVSQVPKSDKDPYRHTQQWKQHNLLDDVPGMNADHLARFPKDSIIEELFKLIRTHYLMHLANLQYPREKVYIHGWANVLRENEWISRHTHITGKEAYLACTYYLTTNPTELYLENPANPEEDCIGIKTEARKIIFFPSWIPHYSDAVPNAGTRISLAFDIVTAATVRGNPWRPHRLLDDPNTMPGIEALLK